MSLWQWFVAWFFKKSVIKKSPSYDVETQFLNHKDSDDKLVDLVDNDNDNDETRILL